MAYTKREMLFSPSTTYISLAFHFGIGAEGTHTNSMQIACTHATRLNLDIDIIIPKRLGLKLILMELGPFLRVLDLEAHKGLWVHHFCDFVLVEVEYGEQLMFMERSE